MPFRNFHTRVLYRIAKASHTSRTSGSPLERRPAFAKLRSTTNFAKIHTYAHCVTACLNALLIYGYYFHTLQVVMFNLAVYTSSCHWLRRASPCPTDGSTLLFLESVSKRVYLRRGSFVSGFTTAIDMLPWTGQDHFDKRLGIYHRI